MLKTHLLDFVRRCDSGVASVEFAFVLPIALVLLMALIDFTRAFNESKRVALISGALADLVSQQSTSDTLPLSQLDAFISAAQSIMTPYSTAGLAVTVSAIQLTPKSDQSCCQAQVQWSVTRNGALRPCKVWLDQVTSTTPPAPTNMLAAMIDPSMLSGAPSGQLIVADVKDAYAPIFVQLFAFIGNSVQRTNYRSLRSFGALNLDASSGSSQQGEQAKVCFSS